MYSRLVTKLTIPTIGLVLFATPIFAQAPVAPTSQTSPAPQVMPDTPVQPPNSAAPPQTVAPAAVPAAPAAPSVTTAAPPATVATAPPAPGTTATLGSLRGRALDSTNAVIPGTTVTITSDTGKTYTTQTTGDGSYLIPNVEPGTYTLTTQVSGFQPYTKTGVKITAASASRQTLHLQLEVTTVVNVKADNGTQLSVSSDANASTLVLSGKDLDALSDDPDELSDELNALAGPAAGPNGGQIYIDGFTGGQLPPKSSIREIRINQNPFSAQYDKIGFGRIEVFTKPGTDKLHGSFQMQGKDKSLNTQALVGSVPQPDYHTFFFQGSLTGPLSKHASYSIGSNYRVIQDNNVVNTTIAPAPTYIPSAHPFVQAIFYPQTRFDISPRLDLQITPTNTLTARYQFDHNSSTDAGTGNNALSTAGYNTGENDHELQMSDSQTIGTRFITETRFEYERDASSDTAQNPIQTHSVQGAFTDFGNGTGLQNDTATHWELQSYTSAQLATHFIRFGGRLRINQDSNSNTSGFAGTFGYGQLQVPVTGPKTSPPNPIASSGSTADLTAVGNSSICPLSSSSGYYIVSGICSYAVVQQQGAAAAYQDGFGPTSFTANYGNPSVSASVADVGLYVEDEWKLRPNMTADIGLRYETQNRIGDHHDVAPRVALAWGVGHRGSAPSYVLRAGYGIFYDRFGLTNVENVARFNGSLEHGVNYSLTNSAGQPAPIAFTSYDVSNISTDTTLTASTSQTTYTQAPNLRAPYTMQAGLSVEHQLFKPLTLTMTYLNSRGVHQFFSQNTARNAGAPANAPNVTQYVSEGIFKQNQLILQATFRGPAGTSLFGFYTYSHANADTAGTGSSPSNSVVDGSGNVIVPNNITLDYGRASFDVHQRVFFGGSAPLPWHISVAPFLIANSGTPFNITLGTDLNGDKVSNDRPSYATPSQCAAAQSNPAANANIRVTQYGCFNAQPALTDARIPVNAAQGPAQFSFNLRLTKTFGFGQYLRGAAPQKTSKHDHSQGPPSGLAAAGAGPGGGGSHGGGGHGGGDFGFGGGGTSTGRKYNLTIGAQALNLFNVVNYKTPVGVLSSPQFGQQTQLAGGIFSTNSAVRQLSLQANFTF